jgi:NitT/TauT family transport system ATP-binding protein
MMPPVGINPVPDCQLTWVFGLLETLDDRGGHDDGYKIARDLQFKFSDLLKVMKTAEILGFVSTPDGDVVLEPLGRRFLDSDVNQRKLLVREQLKLLGLFAYFMRLLRAQEDRSVQKELILEHLAMLLPNESPEKMFSTIVNWGRFAELFGYNKDEDRFYLDQE